MTLTVRVQEASVATQDNSPSPSEQNFPTWWPAFELALAQRDDKPLVERVNAAEAAIFLRLQALSSSGDGQVERAAIAVAMRTLRAIKTEKLNYPDW
jgi:hypothetical protein